VLAQVECLSIVDGSAGRERPVSDISLPHTSESKRAVRFENAPSHQEKIPFDAESALDGGTEILARFFGMWRFKSRQQLRMQMVRLSPDLDVSSHRIKHFQISGTRCGSIAPQSWPI
jgi:hypothetical protein